jgi:hypothetical protein
LLFGFDHSFFSSKARKIIRLVWRPAKKMIRRHQQAQVYLKKAEETYEAIVVRSMARFVSYAVGY